MKTTIAYVAILALLASPIVANRFLSGKNKTLNSTPSYDYLATTSDDDISTGLFNATSIHSFYFVQGNITENVTNGTWTNLTASTETNNLISNTADYAGINSAFELKVNEN
jgi:hypothetical protein